MSEDLTLEEKKIIMVTGASSGIGEACCRYLDSLGTYRLVMVARSRDRMEDIAFSFITKPWVIGCDLTESGAVDKLFSTCEKEGIVLDGLIHSAGIGKSMPIKAIDLDRDFREQMEINTFSFASLIQYFYKAKYSKKGSSIVAVSSLAAMTCAHGMSGYAASKAALDAIVEVAAKEFSRREVRINAILPAYVSTDRIINDTEFEVLGRDNMIKDKQPLGIIPPVAVAELAEFLLSDKSRYITGALIPLSAGSTS